MLPILVVALSLLSLGESAAQDSVAEVDSDPAETEGADPNVYQMGVYITSLHDLDVRNESFGVDYWVWSVHPSDLGNPLENLEFYNAREVDINLDETDERGDENWSQRKIGSVVRHDWDLSNYPFDRQVLDIVLEEGFADTTTLVYDPDTANSGYNEDIELEGWRITNFEVEESAVEYATTFGDPAISDGSSYARLVASVEIQRDSTTGFFKLVAGVYAASAIAILSFLMVPDIAPIFGARMVVLVGALFATMLSLRASEAVLGSTEALSLVDKIHIATMIFIFIAALLAVLARMGCEAGKEKLVERRDRISLVVFGTVLVLVNAGLVVAAAITG